MKRKTMLLKEFCMRYPIQETVLKDVGEKELSETKVWSRSTVYECFKEDAEKMRKLVLMSLQQKRKIIIMRK